MNRIIAGTLGIMAIIGTTFGAQQYLDNRYVLKGELENFPTGAIIAWYRGSTDTLPIPTGWVLCDGKNGTLDLRGKFVRGEHPDLETEGGRKSHIVPDQHVKVFGVGWVQGQTEEHPVGGPEEFQSWNSRNWHILISEGKIPGQEIDLIPPYHEVTFIMKVGKG